MQHFMKGTSKPSFSPRLSLLSPAQMQTPIFSKGKQEVLHSVLVCMLSVHQKGFYSVYVWYIWANEGMFACNVCMCACDGEVQGGDCFFVLFFWRRGGAFLHSYKRGRRGGKCSCSWSKKGKASPGDRALSLCECVCMCLSAYVCLLGSFSTISLHSTHPGDSGASHQMHSSIIHHRNT